MSALLEVAAVSRRFGGAFRLLAPRTPTVHAVQDVSLSVRRGETLGIVGESGCGKSTLARMLVGLDRPSDGAIRHAAGTADQPGRIQYVFQDPVASLNPRRQIRAALETPLRHLAGLSAAERSDRAAALLEEVNLPPDFLDRYPHELSGGQAQRVAIARALAADPELIVLDEPVSALDVSVQAQVLALLADLKARRGLTYVFISHDLSVVETVSDRVAVMYFGRIVETGPAARLFAAPRHPYTARLLASAPVPGRPTAVPDDDPAELPDPTDPPPGCAYAPRCPRQTGICTTAQPELDGEPQAAACYHPLAPPATAGPLSPAARD